jgi:hypothetical protein
MLKGSTGKQTYNLNGQKVLSTGYTIISNDNATDTMTVNCGASVVNVTGGYAQINYAGTGRMILNMATSAWTVAGNWYLGPNIVNNTGTSTVTLSAASTITSNGTKTAYDMIFTGTNKKTFADAPTFDGDLTATTGRVVWSGYNFTTAGDVTFDGTDSLRMGLSLIGNGSAQTFHIGSTVGVCSTAACTIGTTSACALTLDDDKGKTFPKLKQTNSAAAITLTGTGISTFNNARLSGDIVINNTGKDTIQNLTCDSLTVTAGDLSFKNLDTIALYFGVQAGKIDMTGDTVRVGGDMRITVSDSLKANNGTYLAHYGTDDSIVFANSGTFSTTGMNLQSSGTGSVLRCNKALTIDSLTIDANKNLTYNGNSTNDNLSITGATPQIILGNSATLTIRNRIAFTHTASCTPWSLGSGYTINGTDGFYYRVNGTGLTATWPAITHSGALGGAVRLSLSGLSGNTINMTGAMSFAGGSIFLLPATAGDLLFNCNGNAITAHNLYIGSADAGRIIFHAGSGTHNVDSTFFNTYTTTACSLYMDTCTFNVAQRWATPTTNVIDIGKSTVYGTGTGTVTSNSVPFWNFGVNASGSGTVTMADKFKIGNWFKMLDGKMQITNHASRDTVVGVTTLTGDSIDASGDTLFFQDTVKGTASNTFMSVSDATTRVYLGSVKRLTLNGATLPACSSSGSPRQVYGGGGFNKYLMKRAGNDSLTIQAGTKLTIGSLDSVDWSGPDTSNRNRIASSVDDTVRTSRDTLDIPGTRGFAYMRWRNTYSPDTIRCRTGCKSEGGCY